MMITRARSPYQLLLLCCCGLMVSLTAATTHAQSGLPGAPLGDLAAQIAPSSGENDPADDEDPLLDDPSADCEDFFSQPFPLLRFLIQFLTQWLEALQDASSGGDGGTDTPPVTPPPVTPPPVTPPPVTPPVTPPPVTPPVIPPPPIPPPPITPPVFDALGGVGGNAALRPSGTSGALNSRGLRRGLLEVQRRFQSP